MRRALLLVANRSEKMVGGERKTYVGNDNVTSMGPHTVFVTMPCAPVCGWTSGNATEREESLAANDGNCPSGAKDARVKAAGVS